MHDIKDYEAMANLCFSDADREWASGCAETLIKSFDELEKLDVQNIEPLITVLNIKTVLRDDVAVKDFSHDELISNAPLQYDGYFQVPKTVG